MKWITNCWEETKDAYIEKYNLGAVVVGDPKPTDQLSLGMMKSIGIIGIYRE